MATDVTNIELYEELKKTLTERAAQLIAEVIPAGAEVARRSDVDRLEARIDNLGLELKGYIDSRLLRYTTAVVIPMYAMTVAAVIALAVKL